MTAPLVTLEGAVPEPLPKAEKDSVLPLATAFAALAVSVTVVLVVDATVPTVAPVVTS